MDTVTIELNRLRKFVGSLFESAGLTANGAATVTESLLVADIQGIDTHGIQLVPMYLQRLANGTINAGEEVPVVSDNGACVLMDAANTLGQISAPKAVAVAIDKAKHHGVGAVAVRNSFHIGALRQAASAMAEQGCIGIVMANTRPMLPPPGGKAAVTGNNPLAIAVPRSDAPPLVIDLALSAVSIGQIRLAAAEGRSIPESWATDAEGKPTTDPQAAIDGMLQPTGGAKGFALALMIDLLCGGLSGGGVGAQVQGLYAVGKTYNSSQFCLAIDAERFAGVDFLAGAADRLAEAIEAADGRIPGLKAAQALATNTEHLDLRTSTLGSLNTAAESLGVAPLTA